MTNTMQKLCVWSGVTSIALFCAAIFLAGFMPPPGPSMTAQDVAAMYQQNTGGIRAGFAVLLISSLFFPPFIALISQQINRMDNANNKLLSMIQLSGGTSVAIFVMIPAIFFIVTAFRPERPAELTQLLNDLSWFCLIIPWPPFFIQNIAIALAIFGDKRADPILPRWLGYLNIWVAIGLVPGTLMAFFKVGPFAWNGIFVFWLAAAVLLLWVFGMVPALLRAIDKP